MGGSRDFAVVFGFGMFLFLMIPFLQIVVQHLPVTDRHIDRIQQSPINFASCHGSSYNNISERVSLTCR